jgi:D-alanine-D-alanine ligase-like ATP-grasp enzyme
MRKCPDCQSPSWFHLGTWIDDISDRLLPQKPLRFVPDFVESGIEAAFEKILLVFGVLSLHKDFKDSEIPLRSACFIAEAKKHGFEFQAIKGPLGYTGHFRMKKDGKNFRFEGLPVARFANDTPCDPDDKEKTKLILEKNGFPAACGRGFWFWQKTKAVKYGVSLGFPLVVKPRGGSVARHVTTRIEDEISLEKAIRWALVYSPSFIVEKMIRGFVHRGTVADFSCRGCVRQIPANIEGDGVNSVATLVEMKNKDPQRTKNPFVHELICDPATAGGGNRIPEKGERVFVQRDPFVRLGGDIEEVTQIMHPDNKKLFEDIARVFDMRVVGIDFIIPDISKSWRTQKCAVLELNSLPSIELHRYTSIGEPRDISPSLVELVEKYYC